MQEKWGDHEDRSKVQPQLVPVVLICTKYDTFANQYESARKKTICLALRYLAHLNGASLVFASVREKVPSQLYRALLMSHIVEGAQIGKLDTNSNSSINVPAGAD
jgi:dynein light intermediate chain 2, cytosolic